MALDLNSVESYVKDARVLLLDTVAPYRYDDTSLIVALTVAMQEGRRLRADLFIHNGHMRVPQFSAVSGEPVPIEDQFRMAFVFGLCAHALLRDAEDVQDVRANMFMAAFQSMLIGVLTPPISGGTPGPGSPQK